MRIHADEKRKDKVTLAYSHQLRVLEMALDVFDITDPLILQIIALHDSMEDRPEKFEDLMKEIEIWIGPVDDEIRYHMIRLGVRMLSYLKGLSREEAEAVCYQGLRDPESVYGAMPEFRVAFDLLAKDPNLRRRILHGLLLAKLADRMSNWEDLEFFLKAGFDLRTASQSQVDLPGKTFDKTIRSMNPHLTNQPDLLVSAEEIEAYYGFLAKLTRQYVEMNPSRYPQAVPRRQAAMNALRGLADNISGVPAHHRSSNLDAIADRLRRYLPMASADRLPGPWEKTVMGSRITCSYAHDALSIFTSPTSWSLRTGPLTWGSDGVIAVKGVTVTDEALANALKSTLPEFAWNPETKRPTWLIYVTPELVDAFRKAHLQTSGRVADVQWQIKVSPAPKVPEVRRLWNPQLLLRVTGALAFAMTWIDGRLLRLKSSHRGAVMRPHPLATAS